MAVKGLDLFRDHFAGYAEQYVLIGGTACDLIMTDAGLTFRATKDLDIVLCIEVLDARFAKAFWQFVRDGGYAIHETSQGTKRFYRFTKPTHDTYPTMLELFSRAPDVLTPPSGAHLIRIPTLGDVSSLSAILLDDDYYSWIRDGRVEIGGVPIVGPEHLVPLKARAWIDLRARAANGELVDTKTIKKHRNDIFRLYEVIAPDFRAKLTKRVQEDMTRFIGEVAHETVDLKALGLRTTSLDAILRFFRQVYGIS